MLGDLIVSVVIFEVIGDYWWVIVIEGFVIFGIGL